YINMKDSNISLKNFISAIELPGYKLLNLLGKGAMGIVYECEEIKTGRKFAAKILNPKYTQNTIVNKDFETEAQVIAKLKHENIVKVYDLKQYKGIYFILMELCVGEMLSTLLNQKQYSLEKTIRIILGILDALNYAHNKNIIHHDIKPGNIMIIENDHPVLCDFGLATIKNTLEETTSLKDLSGTPKYLSPEKIKGKVTSENAHLSDLFALGTVFYKMVTNQFPFNGRTKEELFEDIVKINPIPPVDININIPLSINAIILKLLVKKPSKRYQSAQAVINDINNYQSKKIVKAFGDTISYRITLSLIRNKKKTIVITLLFIILFSSLFFAYRTLKSENPLWVKDYNVTSHFNTFNVEKKWQCFDPFTWEQYKASQFGDLFQLYNGVLNTNEQSTFILIYDRSKTLGNFTYSSKIEININDNGERGYFYGSTLRGIFFIIKKSFLCFGD
ncbi:hypothetical protein BVX93_00185, partial [bacterium B13(2017)]